MSEEIPVNPDVTYMLEPASVASGSTTASTDDSLIIFCMDVSDSMGSMVTVSVTYILSYPRE